MGCSFDREIKHEIESSIPDVQCKFQMGTIEYDLGIL
jgi:hypothetical protein